VTTQTEFGLLGPVLVRRDGETVAVPGGKQRALLAVLLLNAGRVVPCGDLVEVLWGCEPPASARASLQNYVKRLRGILRDADHRRISTHPHGYMINIGHGELDVELFEASLEAGRREAGAGSWGAAAGRLRTALSLWRGEPLADVDSDSLTAREVPRLAELRLQALETRMGADLHLGRQAGVIAELRRLVGAHPLREPLHALLMLALYHAGRPGEALAAYQDARRVLVEALGTEPGPELRELHLRMLAADPALAAGAAARPRRPAAGRCCRGSRSRSRSHSVRGARPSWRG
jgi:DNA-binding SARP family transcriptional activator